METGIRLVEGVLRDVAVASLQVERGSCVDWCPSYVSKRGYNMEA